MYLNDILQHHRRIASLDARDLEDLVARAQAMPATRGFEAKLKLDSADVMIACFDEKLIGECLKLADELRQKDLRVLVYPEANQKA